MPEKLEKLGKYTILEELGSGAFGWVYKASDPLGRIVAVKVLKPGLADDPVTLERFRREALAGGELFNSHIATILDFDESDGRRFLVMRYVEGVSLDNLIQQKGQLSWVEALPIIGQVAEALDYAHQRGYVHRDVKPSNILVSPKDGAVLTDFGLVKAAEASGGTSSGVILGTPRYIAPEVWVGQTVSPATDVYSLACVAYEILTGRMLFDGKNTPEIMTRHVLSGPQFPAGWPEDVPPGFDITLAHALDKDPQKRIQSAGAFAAELNQLSVAAEQARRAEEEAREQAELLEQKRLQEERDRLEAAARTQTIERERREQEQVRQKVRDEQVEKERQAKEVLRIANSAKKSLFARFWPVGVIIVGLLILAGVAWLIGQKGVPLLPSFFPISRSSSFPTLTPIPVSTRDRAKDGMKMVFVPSGDFKMGSFNGFANEQPIHTVTLSAFWIDQTEVTNAEYAKCVQTGKCQAPSQNSSQTHPEYYGNPQYGSYPVVFVDWNRARDYCAWVGAGLPTEAQWEKAARGQDGRAYPWGNAVDKNRANYGQNVYDTTAVGSYPDGTSPYGAYDMAGNVWEWVNDWYDANYYSNSPTNDPSGPSDMTSHVVRGGSWYSNDVYLRSSFRTDYDPGHTENNLGFRCASIQ